MTRPFFRILFAALPVLLSSQLHSQISFTPSNDLLENADFHSGVAIGVADMNGDGLDDIVRLSQSRILHIEYQTTDGSFTNYVFGPISPANLSQWSLCIADIDNNGYNDVFTAGKYDGATVTIANEDGTGFTQYELPGSSFFSQASNFADINNDGFVDIFACHDDAESRIFGNDANGAFFTADDWIDMTTTPASDNSGNYGSIWTDFDNDGDLDLYIAKCRQGVSNSNDPRRINALFVNDGENNFTEDAASYNLKIGAQSWTADFNDIDNDGDLDCFITNHDVPCMILENDGTGVFTDITSSTGVNITSNAIQGVLRDFDNDGFMDIIVAGSAQHLYRNNGDKTFSELPNPFNFNQMESYAIGDLNHDGFLDVYGGYANIYTTPSNIDDVIWMNDGNDNHFFAVNLIGQESNRNGIGARIEVYGPWGIQIREVRSGESYGIMNSFTQHFGLGTHQTVDSLIVRWPSGVVDKAINLNADQFITIIEDNCASPSATIAASGPTDICPGDSVVLSAPEGYNYLWSTGAESQDITVTEEGFYNVTITDDMGCFGISTNVEVDVDPPLFPTVQILGDSQLCDGEIVLLTTQEAFAYQWSTGDTGQTISAASSGSYSVTVAGLCSDFSSTSIQLTFHETPNPQVEGDTLYAPGSATLLATGENPQWYDAPDGGNLLAQGPEFITPVLNESTTYFVEDIQEFGVSNANGGKEEHGGGSPFSGNEYNGQIIFDCLQPFLLQTVKVYTDTEGWRQIELLDADDMVLQSMEIFIPEGENVLDLQMLIEPGTDLKLTTNAMYNFDQYGFNSPRLQRSTSGVSYPYEISAYANLKTSNYGSSYYYYFYDWQIETPGITCSSERVAAEAVLADPNSTFGLEAESFQLYPNPSKGEVQIQFSTPLHEESQIFLRNTAGALLWQSRLPANTRRHTLRLPGLAPGMYFVEMIATQSRLVKKLVVE